MTETDKNCEELVFGQLRDAFPDHAFIGVHGSAATIIMHDRRHANRLPPTGLHSTVQPLIPRCR